jgi:arsenate reductase-like glutaredoxin family protein
LAKRAGLEPLELLNLKSTVFKAMNVEAISLSPEEVAQLIASNPRVMIRPLLTDGTRLSLGFKPEQMAALL